MARPHSAYAEEWEKNAQIDPLFAILTHPHATDRRWDADAFFATGETEIEFVLGYMDKIGLAPDLSGTFLDFGCGVGRLSRALARRFRAGIGTDISPRMIELAKHYSEGDAVKASYLVNADPDLLQVESSSIDFLYSHLVLQHMPADLQEAFIGEFCRVLKPGGIAAFQLLVEDASDGRRALSLRRMIPKRVKVLAKTILGLNNRISMEMNPVGKAVVDDAIVANGCRICDMKYSNSAEPGHNGRIVLFAEDEISRVTDRSAAYVSAFNFIRKPTASAG